MRVKTWHFELAVVGITLAAVTYATGNCLADWVATLAVLLTFAHGQISDRLAEKEAARETPVVDCYPWVRRYYVGKELLWCAYFVLHRSWPALVGVGLFLLYPLWRRWWRR
jgi:hypothetical protein